MPSFSSFLGYEKGTLFNGLLDQDQATLTGQLVHDHPHDWSPWIIWTTSLTKSHTGSTICFGHMDCIASLNCMQVIPLMIFTPAPTIFVWLYRFDPSLDNTNGAAKWSKLMLWCFFFFIVFNTCTFLWRFPQLY